MSDYPNSGILFRAAAKRTERDRDWRGDAQIDCPHCRKQLDLWLSAWIKTGRKGRFLSLSFKAKDVPSPQPAQHVI